MDDPKNKALHWLNKKWQGDKECPVCRHNQWTIGDAVELRPYQGGSVVIGGAVVPLIPVVCTNCGNTLLISAVVADALPDVAAPTQANEPETDVDE